MIGLGSDKNIMGLEAKRKRKMWLRRKPRFDWVLSLGGLAFWTSSKTRLVERGS